jgi:glycosyltransferase involved in cell wall biosynthesis
MDSPLDLTIVIPVRNEAENLPGCLLAIGTDFARQIIVVDSASTDQTAAIARELGAQVISFQWNGQFPKKRNWLLMNHPLTTKWVLFLDADEYLTPAFKAELRRELTSERAHVGYWLSYSIFFLGQKLKGGYPLRKLALFQVGAGYYERIDEDHWSQLDMEVHEHPVLTGTTGVIKSKIDHQDFRGVTHYVRKHQEYAAWEAARFLAMGQDAAIRENWTIKQRIKYRLMRSVWLGPVFFVGSFFLLQGFRDGARGLAFALLKMAYFTQVYCKLRESADGAPGAAQPSEFRATPVGQYSSLLHEPSGTHS